MKYFQIDIKNEIVTTNNQTCNFYEAGLYTNDGNGGNLTDEAEIREVLEDQHEGQEIEIEFV